LPPVPILAGTTRDEWRIFDTVLDDDEVTDELLRARVRALAGDAVDAGAVLELYGAERPGVAPLARRRAVASALVTDFHFGAPTEQFVRAHAERGNRVHRYELQWASPRPGLGACHDTCLPLVFGTMDTAPVLAGRGADATRMSETVQDAWIAFIRSGDPSTAALGAWPIYGGRERATMLLGATSRVVEHHRAAEMAVWEGRYPASG
jgi:para-nitrobenzyl esterase